MSDYKRLLNLARKDKRLDGLYCDIIEYLLKKPARAKKANDKRGQPTRDWNGEIHFTAQELKDKFKLDMTRRCINKRILRLQAWGYINVMYAKHTWNKTPYLHTCITFNTVEHVLMKTKEYFEKNYRGVAAKLRAESNGSQTIYSIKTDMFINKHILSKEDKKIEKNNQKCETVSAQKPEGEMIGTANLNIKNCNSTKNIKISPSKIKYTKEKADEVIDKGLAIIENHVGLTAPHDNKKLRAYIVYNFKKFGEDWDKFTDYVHKSLKKGGKGIRSITGVLFFVLSFAQTNAYLAQPQQNSAQYEETTCKNCKKPALAEKIQAKTGQNNEHCKIAASALESLQDEINRSEKELNSMHATILKHNPHFIVSKPDTYTKQGCTTELLENNFKGNYQMLQFMKQQHLKLKQDVFNGKWFIENSHRLTKVPIQTPIPVQTPNADVSDSTTEIHTPVLPEFKSENNFEFNFEFENKPVIKSKDKFNLADLIKKTAENCSSKFPKNRIW